MHSISGSTTGVWPRMLQAVKRGASSLPLLPLTNLPTPERKYTDHIHIIKYITLNKVTHVHFCQAPTLNSATIECE